MVEKIRFGGEWNMKKWVAAILFGAIILVFAFWGVRGPDMGEAGGVAAVVNHHSISIAEYRNTLQRMEQNFQQRYEGMPEPQRRQYRSDMSRRVMDSMITSELMFQAAADKGVTASDQEVKEQILSIPFLQENGRFLNDRYRMWLNSMNLSAQDFERQVRKDLVTQKVQELFVSSATPTREELKKNRMLATQKVNLRFIELERESLAKLGSITDADVADYVKNHKSDIENYYRDNKLEFTTQEKYHARDILIKVDAKRTDADALKLAGEIRKKATAKNFAALAKEHSDDPSTKAKGGDLGERERGSMMPGFEQAALALQPGQISEPVQLDAGYHLILLEGKTAASTRELAQVEKDIARKLVARSKETEIVNKLRETVESGDRKAVDAAVAKAGLKWQETGEFDLASAVVPKLGDAKDFMPSVLAKGKTTGLVKRLVPFRGNYVILDVAGWKQTADTTADVEGLDRMVAYRRAEGALQAWAQEVQSRASITRNTRILQ